MAILANEAIMESLVNEYGHDKLVECMKPLVKELNEVEDTSKAKSDSVKGMFWWMIEPQKEKDVELKTLTEDELAEYAEMSEEQLAELDENLLNELNLAGLKNVGGFLGRKAGQAVKGAAQGVASAVANKVDQAAQKLDQLGNEISQQYQKGVKSTVEGKLQKAAREFGELVMKLDTASQKAGDGPINKQQLIMTLQGILKGGAVAEGMGQTDTLNTMVEPQLAPDEAPLFEDGAEEEGGDVEFAVGSQSMGAGVPKPETAPTNSVDVEVSKDEGKVTVSMNESEAKLRNYIKNRLMEMKGLKKPTLNEDKKSDKLKQLDKMIAEQMDLFESIMEEGGFGQKIAGALGKASQWAGGELAKQKQIQQALPTLKSGEQVNAFFNKMFANRMDGGTAKFAARATPDKKLEVLQQAAADKGGLGKVVIKGQDIAYDPVKHAAGGVQSGFAQGRSRLGVAEGEE
jgi:hypothetical protein